MRVVGDRPARGEAMRDDARGSAAGTAFMRPSFRFPERRIQSIRRS